MVKLTEWMPYYQLSCSCKSTRREVLETGSIVSVLYDMGEMAGQPAILGKPNY